MANPDPYTYPQARVVDSGLLRDLLAILLLIIWVVGWSVAAFYTDWRLGVAVVAGFAGIVGAFMSYRR